MVFSYIILALIMASFTKASPNTDIVIYHRGDLAYSACLSILGNTVTYFRFETEGFTKIPLDGGYCNKNVQQAVGAMAHCLKSLPTNEGIGAFLHQCKAYNLTSLDLEEAYNNATNHLVANVTAYPGFNKLRVFYFPIAIDLVTLDGAYRLTLGRYYNYNRANYYGIALISYWVLLILISGVGRIIQKTAPKLVFTWNDKVSNTYRRNVSMPALFRHKVHVRARMFKFFEAVVPRRIEAIYIIIWIILVLAFSVSGYNHESPNVFWPQRHVEMSRKVADRCGIMALYLIPEMMLFAGRNNVLGWVSGWPFARFNIIHRWMARSALVLVLAHAVAMTIYSSSVGWYLSLKNETFFQCALVAAITIGLMCFHSLAALRNTHYEFFVLLHNVFGVVFVACVWVHTLFAGFQQIMYAATAVWGFDKVSRILRLAWFGAPFAEIQLVADETVKVKIGRLRSWNPQPFCYAYIYFLRRSCFWQSHPFTIVDSATEKNVITFYIKVKGGMTSSLSQFLKTQPHQKALIRCSVEGPYGHGEPLQHYESVSFLASGNGIPGPFASAKRLSQSERSQNLKLYWTIRHWKSIEWFYEELQSLNGSGIQIFVYVTQFSAPLEEPFLDKLELSENILVEEKNKSLVKTQDSRCCDQNAQHVMQVLDFIEFRSGRPELEKIIKGDIEDSKGPAAFVTCGHDHFADSVRKTVGANLVVGKRVDFYDTTETW